MDGTNFIKTQPGPDTSSRSSVARLKLADPQISTVGQPGLGSPSQIGAGNAAKSANNLNPTIDKATPVVNQLHDGHWDAGNFNIGDGQYNAKEQQEIEDAVEEEENKPKPKDDPEPDQPQQSSGLRRLLEGAGIITLTDTAFKFWKYRPHPLRRMIDTARRWWRKRKARSELKKSKKEEADLKEKQKELKKRAEAAEGKKLEAEKRHKAALENGTEAEQREARKAVEEAARVADERAVQLGAGARKLEAVSMRATGAEGKLADLAMADKLSMPFRWGIFLVPTAAAAVTVAYLDIKRGASREKTVADTTKTAWNWLAATFVPSDIREATADGYKKDGIKGAVRGGVKETTKDVKSLANSTWNFLKLAVHDPKEAVRETAKEAKSVVKETVIVAEDTVRFARTHNVQKSIQDATIFTEAVADDPRLADQAVTTIQSPTAEIPRERVAGVAGALMNNPAALKSATQLADDVTGPTRGDASPTPTTQPESKL